MKRSAVAKSGTVRRRRKARSGPGTFFARLYDRTKHGVVSIRTKKWEYGDVPFLPMLQEKEEVSGVGAGIIIHRNGYILTNAHVVADAHDVDVKLFGGKRYRASIVWSDDNRDIALIRIKPTSPIRPLRLGRSSRLRVGESVLAIGAPLGLDHTITTGVIGGKNRSFLLEDEGMRYEDVIQTDCAINPGSSGGPLLNVRGAVIGMNSFMAKNRQGLGFAFGIDSIKRTLRPTLTRLGIRLMK